MLKDVIVRALHEGFLETRPLAVLEFLQANPGTSVREIAAELRMPKPAATRALDAMEERGLVAREINREDRRLINVKLTGRGRTLLTRIYGEDRR